MEFAKKMKNFTNKKGLLDRLSKEDGNIESTLVVIPLLILFLISMQIIATNNLRNLDMAIAQGEAARRSISGEFQSNDEIITVGGRIEEIRLLVTHQSHILPQLVPGLIAIIGGGAVTDVVGISVIEPTN